MSSLEARCMSVVQTCIMYRATNVLFLCSDNGFATICHIDTNSSELANAKQSRYGTVKLSVCA